MAKRTRYLSPYDSIHGWMQATKPTLAFDGKTEADWRVWRRQFRAQLVKLLGEMPKKVPLRAEVIAREDMGDYVREKVIYDTEAFASVPAYVLIPKGLKKGEKRPGILAAHGHGIGKNSLVGLDADEKPHEDYQKQLAVQFVKRGYVVVAPDWRGFGERESPEDWVRKTRDKCNVNYMAEGFRGFEFLALQIWDGLCTLDYLQSRKEVDGKYLGCVGVSFGGTMTTYLAALDKRIKCACVSGYISTIRKGAMPGRANFCGAQFMPGLLTLGDIADVAGLIAPRPLVAEMGEEDRGFQIADAEGAFRHLAKIYRAANARAVLVKDRFSGGHEFSGRKCLDVFDQNLMKGL
jgi:dienelactone hydrolase